MSKIHHALRRASRERLELVQKTKTEEGILEDIFPTNTKPSPSGLAVDPATAPRVPVSPKPVTLRPAEPVAEQSVKPEVSGLSEDVTDPPAAPQVPASPKAAAIPAEKSFPGEHNRDLVSKKCPVCKRVNGVRYSHSRGFWEKKILRRLLLTPLQCTFCSTRFYAFKSRNSHSSMRPRETQSLSFFLQPENDKDLHELVREMSRTEKELTARKQSSLGTYEEEQETGLRRDRKRGRLF